MTGWNQALAEAIARIGKADFPVRLEAALSRLMPFRICMIFAYRGHSRPQSLYHNMQGQLAGVVAEDYSQGPYLLDPFYAALQAPEGEGRGVFHLRSLAPDSFFKSEYYLKHYHRTGIRDEMGIPAPLSGGDTAVLSIARMLEARSFSRAEHRLIADVAPVVAALMAAHWREGGEGQGAFASAGAPAPATAPAPASLETHLQRLSAGRLTAREIEVLAMVLKGYSATAIAASLEISEGTVKVHRKNSYRKLGLSSQAELFSRFISIT